MTATKGIWELGVHSSRELDSLVPTWPFLSPSSKPFKGDL